MKHSQLVIAAYAIKMLMQSEAISDTLQVPLEYPFLQDAINAAQEGDVIEVAAGQYDSATIYTFSPCTLTIQARSVDGKIDDVDISVLRVETGNCANITISGLMIDYLYVQNNGTTLNADMCTIGRFDQRDLSNFSASNSFFGALDTHEIRSGAVASFQNCTSNLNFYGWLCENADVSFHDCAFNVENMSQPCIRNGGSDMRLSGCDLSSTGVTTFANCIRSYTQNGSNPDLELSNVNISGFGGTAISHIGNAGTISITGCTIENNSGGGNDPGGINIIRATSVEITNTTIQNNQSPLLGGGLRMDTVQSASILNCAISNNSADNYGGGILISESNVSIQGTQVCGNFPDQISGQWEDLGQNVIQTFCPCPDCNNNGISDCEDVGTGSSSDLNGNNIPDECDPDCDSDGFPDFIEIDQGELDCNRNGVPDFCEVFLEEGNDTNTNGIHDDCESDCNANGVFDFIDISNADSIDSDENGIPDECDQCANSPDCNQNGEPDACEIIFGGTVDINMNLVPDECECVCDVVPNGSVDFSDAILVISSWGPCAAPCPADIVADGEVRYEDLIRVFSNWGPCP